MVPYMLYPVLTDRLKADTSCLRTFVKVLSTDTMDLGLCQGLRTCVSRLGS